MLDVHSTVSFVCVADARRSEFAFFALCGQVRCKIAALFVFGIDLQFSQRVSVSQHRKEGVVL